MASIPGAHALARSAARCPRAQASHFCLVLPRMGLMLLPSFASADHAAHPFVRTGTGTGTGTAALPNAR